MNYEDAIKFTAWMARKNRVHLNPMDIVHDNLNNLNKSKLIGAVLNEKRRDKISHPKQKTCSKCLETKHESEFYFRTDYRINFQFHSHQCKVCYHKYYRERYHKKIVTNYL